MSILRLTTITLSLTLLVACGGGGGGATPTAGGGSGTPTTGREPLPSLLISDAAEVRRIVQASDANDRTRGLDPGFNTDEVRNGLTRIAQEANALLLNESAGGPMFSASRMINCVGMVMCPVEITINGAPQPPLEERITEIAGPFLIGDEEDFAGFNGEFSVVMTDKEVRLAQAIVAGRRMEQDGTSVRREYQNYSGWLEHSAFTVQLQKEGARNMEISGLGAYSFGNASGTKPVADASWNGVMVGANAQGQIIQGEMAASFALNMPNEIRVLTFERIVNLDTGAPIQRMLWSTIPLRTDGTFQSDNGDIKGSFYGTNREEMGGIFDRDNIIGAFGARQ